MNDDSSVCLTSVCLTVCLSVCVSSKAANFCPPLILADLGAKCLALARGVPTNTEFPSAGMHHILYMHM